MAIQNLGTVSTLTAADMLAGFSYAGGGDVRIPISQLATLIASMNASTASRVTQYFSPSAAGFNVLVSASGDGLGQNVWLLITPTGTLATGTITLPAQSICQDRQELLVSTTQTITALTVAGNGSVVNGAPTTLAANMSFRLRFDGVNKAWYFVT